VGAAGFAANPVGSGPWVLTNNQPNVSVSFRARGPHHWLHGAPKFGNVTLLASSQEGTRINQLLTKSADLINISAFGSKSTPLSKNHDTIRSLKNSQSNGIYFFETWHGDLANVNVRKALNLAIDKKLIIKTIFAGIGAESDSQIYPQQSYGYKPLGTIPYDPDQAKTLLKAAVPAGLNMTMLIYSQPGGAPEVPQLAQAVADMWRSVGVNVTNQAMDYATFQSTWSGKRLGPNVAGVMTSGNQAGKQSSLAGVFLSTGAFSSVADPALDTAINNMLSASNLDGWVGYNRTAAAIIHTQYYTAPVVWSPALFAGASSKIGSWKPQAIHPVDFDFLGLTTQKGY
jgi:peptide/nickel transport system substrate-binding protein